MTKQGDKEDKDQAKILSEIKQRTKKRKNTWCHPGKKTNIYLVYTM